MSLHFTAIELLPAIKDWLMQITKYLFFSPYTITTPFLTSLQYDILGSSLGSVRDSSPSPLGLVTHSCGANAGIGRQCLVEGVSHGMLNAHCTRESTKPARTFSEGR